MTKCTAQYPGRRPGDRYIDCHLEASHLDDHEEAETLITWPRTHTKSLAAMTVEVRQVNIEKGWRKGSNTFGDYIALLHSELSEALEAYRDHKLVDATSPGCGRQASTGETCPTHGPAKPEGVGSEFADVLIRLLDTCDVYGIDLAAEYERKLTYNKTRPYQHGGRTLNDAKET